ncbi:ABC transporter substrate-binding protein [Phytohabitans sp. LJ34]|uniref:ABC transporter substrate-binding protein n=1 Tax=Phytohabitans sp. LJ34 TaxID=3452217 RepID=UPI003F8B602D
MRRRPMARWVALALALALPLGAASACGDGEQEQAGGPVTVTFWHGFTAEDGKVLTKLIDRFNSSQSGVVVKQEVNPWDVIEDKLLPALSAGNGPTIIAQPNERLAGRVKKGAYADLSDYYAAPANETDKLLAPAVDGVTLDGKKYGVPMVFGPISLYYNKALFAKAGITAPPATWDEWVTAAQKLTVDANKDGTPEQYGIALPDHSNPGIWPSLFWGNGGDVVKDGKAVLDSPENAETLRFWVDAIRTKKLSPAGLDGINGDKLFLGGKAAMYIGGVWMGGLSKASKIDYGVAMFPAGPKEQVTAAVSLSMSISAKAGDRQAEAAQKFFTWFNAAQQQTEWSIGSGWPPDRTDVPAASLAANPDVTAFSSFTPKARIYLPGVVNYDKISTDVVDELTQKAVAGQGTPEALLAEYQDKLVEQLG